MITGGFSAGIFSVAAYQAELSKLEAILNSAVTVIITIDTNGLIESTNPATERMSGYKASELVGQNIRILMPEPYRDEHDGYLANYLHIGRKKIIGIGREVLGRRRNGTVFPIDLAVSEFAFARSEDIGDIRLLSKPRRLSDLRVALSEAFGRLKWTLNLIPVKATSGSRS